MTLLEIRRKFVELSGHTELVTDYYAGTYTDAGADFYLRQAVRMIKDLCGEGNVGPQFKELSVNAGTAVVALTFTPTKVTKVWWIGSDKIMLPLIGGLPKELFKEQLYDEVLYAASIPTGTPKYYAIYKKDVSAGTSTENLDLILYPSPNENGYIKAQGLFYDDFTDGATNYLFKHYPDVVIRTAIYKMEAFFRSNDRLVFRELLDEIHQIEFNQIETDLNDNNKLLG